MNTRSTSKRKSADCRKTKSKNTDAEVFVLPPNLLEKLGIKLDKIQSTENNSTDSKNILDLAVNNSGDHQENETDNVNTDKPRDNESESSILETASLMKESVFLSPTFVPTISNAIPGEVEIASIHKECKNNSENLIQELVNIEKNLELLSSEQELLNTFESVNTAQSDSLKNLQVHDNCFSEMNDNCCEYNETPNISEFIETENIHDEQESQDSLNNESQNISLKPNENQENKKNKINIINDEIIDIAKINKLLNFDNNNFLTPVSVGMLLPPTKAYTNTLGSNGLKMPESSCSQSHKNDTNLEKSEPNCVNVGNDINAHSSNADVPQVSNESNSGNDEKCWEDTVYHKNKQFDNIELCILNSIDAASENLENIATELKEDAQSKTSLIIIGDNIQDQDSQYCPVFTKFALSPEIGNDRQRNGPRDYRVKLQINSINIQEDHSISEENYLLEKNDVNDCNEICNSINKDKFCSIKQNKHGCNVETCSTLASNILPCNSNDTIKEAENDMRQSKLCRQGVEKPGGLNKPENSIANVYSYRQTVNKPMPDTRNKKQTSKIIQPVIYPPKNTQVMQSLKTYKRQRLLTHNDLVQNSKKEFNLSTKKMSEALENQINDIVIDTVCKKAEYCLCSDFGRLGYYDEDSFYEHIHYWQHKNIACKPDLIFSMYVDNVTNKYEEDSIVEMLHETPEESSHTICWNEVYYDGEEMHLNLEKVNQNIVSEQLMSAPFDIKKNNKIDDRGQNSIDVEMCETDNNNIIKKYTKVAKSENWSSPNSSFMSNTVRVKEDANKVTDVDANKSVKADKSGDANIVRDSNKAGDVNEVIDVNKLEKANEVGGANQCRYVNAVEDANKVIDINKVENENMKTGKKRRRSLRVTKEEEERFLDHTKRLSKRDVKCGVCGLILARQEWEEHLNKEHGFIAWKAGDIFDSQDKKMIIKVKQKLKDGVLKCTFCNSNFNRCEEYITHVHECTKNKVLCSSHVVKSNSSTSFTTMETKKTRLSKSCNKVELISTAADFSQKINTTNYLPSPVKEKTMKSDEPLKNVKLISGIPSLEQKTLYCDSSKKLNIDTATTLTTSTKILKHSDSHEKNDISSEITSTPLVEEKSLRVGNSKKKIITYSKCKKRESFKKMEFNIENISTPFVEEESLKGDYSPVKGEIDSRNISTTLLQERAVKCRDSSKIIDIDTRSTSTSIAQEVIVKCGVCKQEMKDSLWIDHTQKAHNYLAWKEGDSSLDLEDENQVWQHLHLISKKFNGLVCSKCGLSRKYVKAYLSHIKNCDGIDKFTEVDTSMNVDINDETVRCGVASQEMTVTTGGTLDKEKTLNCGYSPTKLDHDSKTTLTPLTKKVAVKCGVCEHEIDDSHWNDHMQKAHNYVAWKEGESSLDLQDKNQIWQHLHSISIKYGGLICPKCGLNRKYVKSYLSHIKRCDGMDDSTEADSSKNMDIDTAANLITLVKENAKKRGELSQEVNTRSTSKPSFEEKSVKCDGSSMKVEDNSRTIFTPLPAKVTVNCGVCKQEMDNCLWKDHMQKEHNYLAWKEGESSLDLEDEDQIWQHLHSISKKCDGLVCPKCGLNRKYVKAYLSHIKQCDGMDDSSEADTSKNKNIDIATSLTTPVKENISKCSRFSQDVNTECIIIPLFKDEIKCSGSMKVENDNDNTLTSLPEKVAVNCGVCKQVMDDSFWNCHMQKEHNYLAWKEGESPIELQDEDQLWQHLHLISKKCDGLVCPKCGLNRKYVKAYLSHIKQCDGMDKSIEAGSSKNMDISIATTLTPPVKEEIWKCGISSVEVKTENTLTPSTKEIVVKCGVCKQEMDSIFWNDHMWKEHNYLAWKEGESSLDLQDKDQIWQYLHSISKKFNGLVCVNCGLNRKYVKGYLSHIKGCDGATPNNDSLLSNSMETSSLTEVNTSQAENGDLLVEIKCGVCSKTCLNKDWITHIQSKHDYLAWKEGETPLNLQDQEAIENHLRNIIKNHGSLYCRNCGVDRKYGTRAINIFLQHIDTSGKYVDTEIEDKKPILNSPIPFETVVKCGVCEQDIRGTQWIDHIGSSHNYLAWRHGEQPLELEDTDNLKLHFCKLSKQIDAFKCAKCGFRKKYPKPFIDHLKTCDAATSIDSSKHTELTECAVCLKQMKPNEWSSHAMEYHYNVAWKVGAQPIDLKSSQAVEKYLKEYKQVKGVLVCKVCGISRVSLIGFYAHVVICGKSEEEIKEFQNVCEICHKVYVCVYKYQHMTSHREQIYRMQQLEKVKEDNKNTTETTLDATGDENHAEGRRRAAVKSRGVINKLKTEEDTEIKDKNPVLSLPICSETIVVKCGVCEQDIEGTRWVEHIGCNHNYLAWKHGEPPLELEDTESVKLHFSKLSKQLDAFKCAKCGFRKKYPKLFIDHIGTCNATTSIDLSRLKNTELTECAVCSQQMKPKEWRSHAMDKHYNVAWRVGDHPIDLKSSYAVEKYLKEYKQVKGVLVCNVCGISRVSVIGFYAHVLLCGKSDEELEDYQNVCEICNKAYVCVYKNQHMTAHREQEYAKERKMQRLEKENEITPETLDTTGDEKAVGRRRAAVKARNVIEKLKTEEDEQNNTCATCGFEAATARKFARHKCVAPTFESGSDTDDSYESDESNASNESDGSNLHTEVSEEEKKECISKKKRYKESIVTAKVPNLPFKYNKLDCYTNQSAEDFFKIHFTDEILFPEWLDCKYEHLEDSQFTDYLPKVEQSCKIKLDEKWDTFNRFEVKSYNKGCSIFVGGSVKCLSWIPPCLNEDDQSGNYLAVSCHRDTDTPRYNFDELSTHSGVIQIWDFDNFNNALPKLVLCIAHDYGTVWAMDWCPSGVRDINAGDKAYPRLGLLAVACSNGFVYVFSVPYPSSIAESEKLFFKLMPVAELRISMSSERKVYQATAISWSKQKGHAIIMVGYADGTTALYDLCSTTPFLKCIDNGVTVFYPYHDRRDHNVCITDVDICPSGEVGRGAQPGAMCSTSLAGSVAQQRVRAGQPRLDNRSPAAICKFTPGWPSVLVAPEDTIATQSPNELDWYGCGRRLGPTRALSTCHHCSRVLVYMRPLLRYIDALPPYTDFKKQTVALIKTSPLAKKRKIANDKLAMLVEPLTYDEVVTQYGVEVTVFNAHDNNPSVNSMRETFTERFPLADVSALGFCRARAHHRVAAVGLHAGFVLILTV